MPVVPFVAIEIPAEVAPELASMVMRTCNLALGSGRCLQMDATQPNSNARWLAYVGVDPTLANLLRIELRDALPLRTRTTYSRALNFEESDAPAHRWSTVGVVVAALVISAESGKGPGSSTDTPPRLNTGSGAVGPSDADARANVAAPPKTKSNQNSPDVLRPAVEAKFSKPESRRALRFDLGGLAGSGVEGLSSRFGITLRPSIELTPNIVVWVQASGSRAKDTISVSWLSGAAGLGFVADILPRSFAVEARIAILGDRLAFNVTDETGANDSASRWRYGAGAGLDAVLSLGDSLGLFVGIDGTLANPKVKLRQAGKDVGQSPTTEALISAGLRWRIAFGP